MTIALSQLTDLQRVRLALSDRADGTVLVERSATSGFQLPETVRGGVELPISAGVGQLDDYEFLADAANHYRVTPVDPAPGLRLTGTSGDYASTPDNAALDITGDLDLRVDVTLDDWSAAGAQTLVAKYNTTDNQRSYQFVVDTAGTLSLQWSTDGTTFENATSTEPVPVEDGGRIAVRATLDVDNGNGGWTVRFSTSTHIGDGAPPFTQLGDERSDTGTTSIFSGSAALTVGGRNDGTANLATGTVHWVSVRSGIAGTLVADADFVNQDHGDTSFTDTPGRTWTVNGDATIEAAETDSITPSLGGKVWLKSVRWPLGNVAVRVADYSDIEIPARSSALPVEGRALPTGVFELGLGRDHTLILRTTDQATVDHIMMLVRTGDWFLVHVPTVATGSDAGNTMLPGSMHVMIGTPRVHRIGGVSAQHLISLPLTEVTAPGPDVVGTTLTIGGLLALHGSLTAVWAAYPTLRDEWDAIGSVDDLVTI